jgi:prolyl 4-hydroxylase|tara:strand:- start:1197 stop:1817 length:621 start_codon:yes stop_codon:yes gene_type:complete
MVRRSPNIYTIDDFLTSNECEHLLKFVEQKKRKFKASFTEAEAGKKVLSTERTSTFIHFKKGADSIVRTIERRAAEIVGATSQNVEPLQVVSYTKGQKFNLHHDAATLNDDGSCTDVVPPRRIATLFVYLNTLPEGMGHTEFPRLDLSVRPVACKAVLWSNLDIHSGKPCEADPMTVHKACPVPEGYRKVGLNIWVTDVDLQHLAL